MVVMFVFFFFSSRRRHTRWTGDWSSDVCSSDLVQELLPRAQDVLVRGEHRDQRAERQAALDHEIAADRVEEERRDLREEVVQELDEELAPVDVEADRVDLAEAMADVGALELQRVVAANLREPGHRFAD